METEKKMSKAELYLARLEKWREEKKLKVAVVKKGPVVKAERKDVPTKCPVGGVPRTQKTQHKPPGASLQKAGTARQQKQPGTKISRATPTTKVLKPVSNEGCEDLVGKLHKWRKDKELTRSTQKMYPPSSTSKSTKGPVNPKCSKFISVKSRLFDYQHKPAPSVTAKTTTGKENRTSLAPSKTSKTAKLNTQDRLITQKKPALKRRHSEALQEPPRKKKPVGILKRKSCIGSFDMTKGDNSKQTDDQAETERRVDVKPGECEDDVFTQHGEDTHHVRFTTPEHRENHKGRELRKTPKPSNNKSQELSDWLKAKGRTPSKFRHLLCFHDHDGADAAAANDPHTKTALTVDELSEQREVIEQEQQEAEARAKLDVMLNECMTLFEAGCPTEAIIPWLESIYTKIPLAKSAARFYICKAAVVKTTYDLDAVLQVFEDATINDAQPKEAIAKCLTETIKYVTEEKIRRVKRRSRSQHRSGLQEENVFQSSSVVYVVSEATPISEGKRGRRRSDTPVAKVITPVRRSTRRSLKLLPGSLRDDKETFSCLAEVDEADRDKFLFQPNLALDGLLAESEQGADPQQILQEQDSEN